MILIYQSQNQQQESMSGQSGTGIGLYLCKRIIHLYNGNIAVKNNRGAGCSFRILLPLQYAENAAIESDRPLLHVDETDEMLPTAPPAQMTILVVEDNKDMRDYISSILREKYTIVEANDGKEALDILRKQYIDFIISDLMMPVMDGMELSDRKSVV